MPSGALRVAEHGPSIRRLADARLGARRSPRAEELASALQQLSGERAGEGPRGHRLPRRRPFAGAERSGQRPGARRRGSRWTCPGRRASPSSSLRWAPRRCGSAVVLVGAAHSSGVCFDARGAYTALAAVGAERARGRVSTRNGRRVVAPRLTLRWRTAGQHPRGAARGVLRRRAHWRAGSQRSPVDLVARFPVALLVGG